MDKRAIRAELRSERGITLVELTTTILISTIGVLALFTVINVATRASTRVTDRIEATRTGRPVMQTIIDDLHSACIAPQLAPIQSGSTGSSMTFLTQTGSAVSPTAEKHTITWSGAGGSLTERVYLATGGSAPSWTFASTPSSTRILATGVDEATINGAQVRIFQYYAYVGASIPATPLAVPLSAADAARAVQVIVSYSIRTHARAVKDLNGDSAFSEAAILRFSPAEEDITESNLPCA